MNPPDPTEDIYQMMDEVGLSAGNLKVTRQPMEKMVLEIRSELNRKFREYMEARDQRPEIHIDVRTEDGNGKRI